MTLTLNFDLSTRFKLTLNVNVNVRAAFLTNLMLRHRKLGTLLHVEVKILYCADDQSWRAYMNAMASQDLYSQDENATIEDVLEGNVEVNEEGKVVKAKVKQADYTQCEMVVVCTT